MTSTEVLLFKNVLKELRISMATTRLFNNRDTRMRDYYTEDLLLY